MKTVQLQYSDGKWLPLSGFVDVATYQNPDLVMAFLPPALDNIPAAFEHLRQQFPDSIVTGCTTGGQIQNNEFLDDVAVAVAISFGHTGVRLATTANPQPEASFGSGTALAKELASDGLCGIFVLSEGLTVNGSDLIRGLKSGLPSGIPISGGMAGDGSSFSTTMVGANGSIQSGTIAAVGFYGDRLELRHSYGGGWNAFGPERIITRSESNVLYELDGKPALALYKRYLGEEAEQLPGSAMLYPLKIWNRETGATEGIVRTVLAVDEEAQSLTFAGNMPEGFSARLMTGTYDNIITGAGTAAESIGQPDTDSLAIMVSCIGRKLMLGQRVFEEVEEVHGHLGSQTSQIGFYSYGELCPNFQSGASELHNQTMTITLFSEK